MSCRWSGSGLDLWRRSRPRWLCRLCLKRGLGESCHRRTRYAVIQGYNCRESVALTSGTKLGPYEIVEPLGASGMGEVYRARDTRLGRDVAIKVLPSHLSSDANLKVRFEREARAISSLSHPNICTLHDVGSQNGVDFLVMEYLE